jgi:D-amino peptidase
MKVYISADMEGVTGVSHWEEVDHNKSAYIQFQKQMSLEVAAACEGAVAAGAKEILVTPSMSALIYTFIARN